MKVDPEQLKEAIRCFNRPAADDDLQVYIEKVLHHVPQPEPREENQGTVALSSMQQIIDRLISEIENRDERLFDYLGRERA